MSRSEMTSIADSSILIGGSVSARGSGVQHATRAHDQGVLEEIGQAD
jgi:hypothetical protein